MINAERKRILDHMNKWLEDTSRDLLAIANDVEAANHAIDGMNTAVIALAKYLNGDQE